MVYHTPGCDWDTVQVMFSPVPELVAFTVVPLTVDPQVTATALHIKSLAGGAAGVVNVPDTKALTLPEQVERTQ